MYKSLNAESLGISARPNELIELALTYKYGGLDLNVAAWSDATQTRGRDQTVRFLQSANIRIGGFELPVRWTAADAEYQQDLAALKEIAETTAALGATHCTAIVPPYCEQRPYHEDFEFHRERFTEIAEILKEFGIRLGLGFLAPIASRAAYETQFITSHETLLALVQTIVSDNVGICLDLWHWHVSGATLETIKQLSPEQITSVRIADIPTDVSMDSITEHQRLVPGSTGIVPAAETLQWLCETDYEGPITAYCHADQFSGVPRIKAVAQVAKALDDLLAPAPECSKEEAEPAAAAQ